ncbi:hypothetical protein Acr_10g0009990 [Actinidia rufa]|uniref:Reverse transcriptase domain-containing protein n=1 Tax=Actinidia rufa TaxID=165716 RepID=A0A7J0FA86_9ERIC|nr:hypothetical protein Acr_10g0009990 [Actinidia rufa]
MRLTRLFEANTVVLSKVDFDDFCTEPETRPNRFDRIDARLSQIVLPEFDWGCWGLKRKYSRNSRGSICVPPSEFGNGWKDMANVLTGLNLREGEKDGSKGDAKGLAYSNTRMKATYLDRCLVGSLADWKGAVPRAKELEAWCNINSGIGSPVEVKDMNGSMYLFILPSTAEVHRICNRRWAYEGVNLELMLWEDRCGCYVDKNKPEASWVTVLGLPIFLWSKDVFRALGDRCRRYIMMAEETLRREHVKWAMICVKGTGTSVPATLSIGMGSLVYECQIWVESGARVACQSEATRYCDGARWRKTMGKEAAGDGYGESMQRDRGALGRTVRDTRGGGSELKEGRRNVVGGESEGGLYSLQGDKGRLGFIRDSRPAFTGQSKDMRWASNGPRGILGLGKVQETGPTKDQLVDTLKVVEGVSELTRFSGLKGLEGTITLKRGLEGLESEGARSEEDNLSIGTDDWSVRSHKGKDQLGEGSVDMFEINEQERDSLSELPSENDNWEGVQLAIMPLEHNLFLVPLHQFMELAKVSAAFHLGTDSIFSASSNLRAGFWYSGLLSSTTAVRNFCTFGIALLLYFCRSGLLSSCRFDSNWLSFAADFRSVLLFPYALAYARALRVMGKGKGKNKGRDSETAAASMLPVEANRNEERNCYRCTQKQDCGAVAALGTSKNKNVAAAAALVEAMADSVDAAMLPIEYAQVGCQRVLIVSLLPACLLNAAGTLAGKYVAREDKSGQDEGTSEQPALVIERNWQQEQMVINCDTVDTGLASEEQQFKVIANKAKGTEAGIHVPRKNVANAENEKTKGQKTKYVTNQFQVLDGLGTKANISTQVCRNPRAATTTIKILERPQSSNTSTSPPMAHMDKWEEAVGGKQKKDTKNLDRNSKATSLADFCADMGGAMVNDKWVQEGMIAQANFGLPGKNSDHSPCVVSLFGENDRGASPFKFFNMWAQYEKFLELISNVWSMQVEGSAMFMLCRKLKALKGPLKALNRQNFSHISARAEAAEEELLQDQQYQHDNTGDANFQSKVSDLRVRALKLAEAEMSFSSQLAKAKYLKNFDKGTKFFHDLIKSNGAKNLIASIFLADGNKDTVLKGNVLEVDQANNLTRAITEEEIKLTLFSIGDDKVPEPDGFTSCFFKKAWDIVGRDFIAAIMEFFASGQIHKQINHSVLALIPKSKDADRVEDFRPIAYYNVTYKLLRQYGCKRSSPRCILDVDLRKAFDSVDWAFVQDLLTALQFPPMQERSKAGRSPLPIPICAMLRISFQRLRWTEEIMQILADDLVLFSRGDPTSVALLMENLNHFGDYSGSKISFAKSSIFSVGICSSDMEYIMGIIGFSRGSFPFRYLGIPVADSRLSIAQCSPLIDKISGYISAWAGAMLSYAGRTELVKSVFQGVECFWLSILPIPVGVKAKID